MKLSLTNMWTEQNGILVKEFKLKSFSDLIARLPSIAEVADEMNHHPDFSVFGYCNIRFELKTHDKNAITEKDYRLAEKIDAILER